MTIQGVVNRQATSFTVSLVVPRDEMTPRFDKYWNEVKDLIPANVTQAALKGGYRKATRQRIVKASGGKNVFYAPVLAEVVGEYLDTQQQQALSINAVEMHADAANVNIESVVFLEPGITWKTKPGIDGPINIKLVKEPPNLVELLVDQELRTKQGESVVLVPLPDETAVELGHVIVLDADSKVVLGDGTTEQWAPGTFAANKWLVDPTSVKLPVLVEVLVGATKGVERTVDVLLDDKFGEEKGKTIRAKLKVLQVLRREEPKIDDDLAKTNGHDSLVIYKQALTSAVTKKVIDARTTIKKQTILAALANNDVLTVEPLPIDWLRAKGQEYYFEGRKYTKTEEEFVSKFQGAKLMNGSLVNDRGTVVRFLAERAATELIQDLIIRSWGKLKGVEGDSTLKNLGKYNEAVVAEILKVVVVEEVEESAVQKAG